MSPEAIQSVLKMRPFRPFTIHTNGGWVYPAADPTLIRMSPTSMTLLAVGPGGGRSKVATIDVASVTSLTLDATTTETT